MGAGQRNLDHVSQTPSSDCGDPDCELHSPWVIEDEDARLTAIAWYVAGAEFIAGGLVEFIAGGFEEKLRNILDKQSAPDRP